MNPIKYFLFKDSLTDMVKETIGMLPQFLFYLYVPLEVLYVNKISSIYITCNLDLV